MLVLLIFMIKQQAKNKYAILELKVLWQMLRCLGVCAKKPILSYQKKKNEDFCVHFFRLETGACLLRVVVSRPELLTSCHENVTGSHLVVG